MQFTATVHNDEEDCCSEADDALETQNWQLTEDGGLFDTPEGHATDDETPLSKGIPKSLFLDIILNFLC